MKQTLSSPDGFWSWSITAIESEPTQMEDSLLYAFQDSMAFTLVIPINTGSFSQLQILSPVLNLKAYPRSAEPQPWRAAEVGGWSLTLCLVWRASEKETCGGRSGHVFMRWVAVRIREVPGVFCVIFFCFMQHGS